MTVPVQGSPIEAAYPRVPLYVPEFATDPHRYYRRMRDEFGALAPVELAPGVPATLVLGYQQAVRILNDPEHFPADPGVWQQGIPAECPIKPMMEKRPNALRTAGEEHQRYRHAYLPAIDKVDLNALHRTVEKLAIPMINAFSRNGTADLRGQYAFPLAFQVLNELLGLDPEVGHQAYTGMAAILDAVDAESAAEGNARFVTALMTTVTQKREHPGEDLVSWLMARPAGLDDMEMVQQAALLYSAGTEPTANLITNALLLMMADDRFGGHVLGGSVSTRDAINEVLFNDPPLSNFCTSYPPQPVLIDGIWLPAHQPVVISIAACNNDPAISGGYRIGNRSHLAWGLGPHACMAQQMALAIATEAIDQLLDALPEIRLGIAGDQIAWRPGPFHRALVSLPVTFPESGPFPVSGH